LASYVIPSDDERLLLLQSLLFLLVYVEVLSTVLQSPPLSTLPEAVSDEEDDKGRFNANRGSVGESW